MAHSSQTHTRRGFVPVLGPDARKANASDRGWGQGVCISQDRKPDIIDVEDHKTVTIIVEGTPHEWPEEYITYEQVVTLEVPDYSQNHRSPTR